MNAEFDQLFEDFLNGQLDEHGISVLDRLLQEHRELVGYAADLLEEHRLLGVVWQAFNQQTFCDQLQLRLASMEQSHVERILGSLAVPTGTVLSFA
jgi:hypothetical protein